MGSLQKINLYVCNFVAKIMRKQWQNHIILYQWKSNRCWRIREQSESKSWAGENIKSCMVWDRLEVLRFRLYIFKIPMVTIPGKVSQIGISQHHFRFWAEISSGAGKLEPTPPISLNQTLGVSRVIAASVQSPSHSPKWIWIRLYFPGHRLWALGSDHAKWLKTCWINLQNGPFIAL